MRARIAVAALLVLMPGVASLAEAQAAWPAKPIRLIVPFPAGGQLDLVARVVADKISPVLGQPIVVESRPGADGNIGTQLVASSAPDGHTWLAASVPFTTQVSLRPQTLGWDPIRDFQPVVSLGTSSFVLVVPATLPVKTLEEFVAYAKARPPGELSYGGSSAGSVVHLSAELFQRAAGTRTVMIPNAGMPPTIADLVTGRTQFMSLGIIAALPMLKAGRLRPLAVLDPERHPLLPDVPTIVEKRLPGPDRRHLVRIACAGGYAEAHYPADQPRSDQRAARTGCVGQI